MTRREGPVLTFPARVPPGSVRDAIDKTGATAGRMVPIADVALLLETAGFTVTNAAVAPGTALPATRTEVDLADAGVDSVRVVVRANNSAAGSVVVTVHDVTNNLELCRVTVTGVTATTYLGAWTRVVPKGGDSEIEVRVIGDGVFDPLLFTVHLQLRTTQARA